MTGPGLPVPGTFDPLSFFPGPRGENTAALKALFVKLVDQNTAWRASFPAGGPALTGTAATALNTVIADLSERLGQTFPFHGPQYLAHQQNDVQLASLLGVVAGTLYNANNVTVESGLSTVELELIACDRVMRMLGYRPPQDPATTTDPADLGRPLGAPSAAVGQSEVSGWFGWAHLCSGGTTANMEALWIARVVRYMPLSIQAAANTQECVGIHLPVQLTADELVDIRLADPVQLLRLRPSVALSLLEMFTSALIDLQGSGDTPPDPKEIAATAKHLLARPDVRAAASDPTERAGHQPVIFAPRTAHYSLTKAADLLGMGRQSLVLVDVDEQFRMDIEDLRRKLTDALRSKKVPIAVVAVVGTTEEGSVDPVLDVLRLRKEFETGEFATSFWIHVDGAWGAYLASMLVQPPADRSTDPPEMPTYEQISAAQVAGGKPDRRRAPGDEAEHWVAQAVAAPNNFATGWASDTTPLVTALQAMNRADSITVDPHKLGHLAYPCGLVAYRDDRVRDFIAERAPYLTNLHGHPDGRRLPVRRRIRIDPATGVVVVGIASLGPYTLEGSRPAAAATSLWAATELLPLHREAHGALLAQGMRASRYLHTLLQATHGPAQPGGLGPRFSFVTLTPKPSDTNIVLFTVKPGGLGDPVTLSDMNKLTAAVRDAFTIKLEEGQNDPVKSRPLFLSSTTIDDEQYPLHVVTPFLARAAVTDPEKTYQSENIVVIRAVTANPYTWELIRHGFDPIRTAVQEITTAALNALS